MLLAAHRALGLLAKPARDAHASALARLGNPTLVPESLRDAANRAGANLVASWERLDAPERAAWEAWRLTRSQVRLLQQDFKKDKQVVIHDMSATWLAFDALDVPNEWRQRAWAGVELLSDMEHHGGRDHRDVTCIVGHVPGPMTIADPACPRCKSRWRCHSCGDLFALHRGCDG